MSDQTSKTVAKPLRPRPNGKHFSKRALEALIRQHTERCVESIEDCDYLAGIDFPLDIERGSTKSEQLAKFLILVKLESNSIDGFLDRADWLAQFANSPCREMFKTFLNIPHSWLLEFVVPISEGLENCLNGLAPYERLSEILNPKDRKSRGVYFTPPGLAKAMVAQIDQTLMASFGLKNGIASKATRNDVLEDGDPGSFVQILDPAAGCGVFLTSCFNRMRAHADSADEQADFLQRLHGFEICPVALAIAHLKLISGISTETLHRLNEPLKLFNLNTLKLIESAAAFNNGDGKTGSEQLKSALSVSYSVCLGNPPFGSLTTKTLASMHDLLHGISSLPQGQKDYFSTDRGKILQRKTWLHDLYVQFFRIAQWLIDQSQAGLISFVSNANYLDNLSFSGMRYQLLDSFPNISIKTPAQLIGQNNQANFPIATPIVIGQFNRPPQRLSGKVSAVTLGDQAVHPQAPSYKFVRSTHRTTFEQGTLITDLMPLKSSAIVTARDWLTIGFDRAELMHRLSRLADPQVEEGEFRELAAKRTRSARYTPGDSRGWKLTEARTRLANDDAWQATIIPCWYRAMDRRWIAFHPGLIDWPRLRVSEKLLGNRNVALIARKQMVAGRRSNYFWVVDAPAIDGLIRSDNRGNEFVFPLFNNVDCTTTLSQVNSQNQNWELNGNWSNSNFDLELPEIARLRREGFSAFEVFALIYAQFCSREYQTRFNHDLVCSFPRAFFPSNSKVTRQLAMLGKQLIGHHLQRTSYAVEVPTLDSIEVTNMPKWNSGEVSIDGTVIAGDVSEETWNFTAGAHQSARKWLKDRRGHTLSAGDLKTYRTMLHCIEQAQSVVNQIDTIISQSSLLDSHPSA